jgi:maltose O-acetyltransferase
MSRSTLHRCGRYIGRQTGAVHPRVILARLLVACLPFPMFPELRASVYRAMGFKGIGGVRLLAPVALRGWGDIYSRLVIGHDTMINHSCDFDLNGSIQIGKNVSIGNHVMIVTANHEIGEPVSRCGRLVANCVSVGDGAWIGAGVMLLPGVTVGTGAMVMAGSVVANDVPVNAKVAGNPARVVGWLDGRAFAARRAPP